MNKGAVRRVCDSLGVNWASVPLNTLYAGMKVEAEHGKADAKTNVTDDSLVKTAKIALAHIVEAPNYYTELKKMESKLKKVPVKKREAVVFKPKKKSSR